MPPELMTDEDRLKLDPQMVAFLQSRGQGAPAPVPRAPPAVPVEPPPMRTPLSSLDPKIIDYLQQHDAEAKDYNAKQDLREGVGRSMNYFMGKPVSPNMGPPKVDDEMQKFLIHQSTLRNYGAMNDPMRLPPSEDQVQRAMASGMDETTARGFPTLGAMVQVMTRPPPKAPEAETYIPIPGSGVAVGKHDPTKQVPLPPPIQKPPAPGGGHGGHGGPPPNVTDEALNRYADQFNESGALPPGVNFRGAPELSAAIANRAAERKPGGALNSAVLDQVAFKHQISSLNSTQQVRLTQAINSASKMIDNVEKQYGEWNALGKAGQFPAFNKLSLSAAKNMPGRAGEVARSLDANIADLTSDLAVIYQGGNTPTEEALKLARQQFGSEWSPGQFEEGLKQARHNVRFRLDALSSTRPAGLSESGSGSDAAKRFADGAAKIDARIAGSVRMTLGGKTKMVPADQVELWKSKGATEVK